MKMQSRKSQVTGSVVGLGPPQSPQGPKHHKIWQFHQKNIPFLGVLIKSIMCIRNLKYGLRECWYENWIKLKNGGGPTFLLHEVLSVS